MTYHPRYSYRLFSADRATFVCDAVLSFSALSASHGRVTFTLTYPTLSGNGPVKCHAQSQSWFQNSAGERLMCVGRFSLPDVLKRQGIGTWLWSSLHRHLPDDISDTLILTGSLSSTDAWVPQINDRGCPVVEENGPKWFNQVDLRNRFWSRMLSPIHPQSPTLWCDKKGNGAFRGVFTDPLPPEAPRHLFEEQQDTPFQKSA